MATDVFDLVDSLKRSVNPPGSDLYPAVTNGQWVGYLEDAFWAGRIEAGLYDGYSINANDEIVPNDTGPDLSRDEQQAVVLYAALAIITSSIQNNGSLFRAKAGPVEFETQTSATMQKGILDELQQRRNMILRRLSDLGRPDISAMNLYTIAEDNYFFGDDF